MKVYLDTCSLQRPLDSKTQIRVILESEAVLGIIGFCETGEIGLVSSAVLIYEVKRNPKIVRREFGLEVLSKAEIFVKLNQEIEERAKVFEQAGIKPLDALHLASAEEGEADYFCTCDDKLLRKVRTVADVKVQVGSPIELIEEIEKW